MPAVSPAKLPQVRRISLPAMALPTTFKHPKITIGGVPLTAQRFTWGLTPGVMPYKAVYQFVDGPLVERLKAIQNPTTITVDVDGEIGGKGAAFSARIENVWIRQPIKVDAFHWAFEITDLRSRWEGQKWTWTANRTWRRNEFGAGFNLAALGDNDPARLREQFDRFEKFRYLAWGKNPRTEKPWTALELLVESLKDVYGGADVAVLAGDNGVVQENMEWREEPVQHVISELCSLARVEIGVSLDGKLHIYSSEEVLTPSAVMPIDRPPVHGGVLYFQDLKRIRPKHVNVRFAKRKEVLVKSIDATTAPAVSPDGSKPVIGPTRAANGVTCPAITENDYITGKVVACWNVVKATRDFIYNGTTYQKGQWVPMSIMIAYMGFEDEEFRSKFFNDIFMMEYAVLRSGRPQDKPDIARLQEASAVKQAYRRIYQMDPYWVQRWETWDPKRAALIDYVTRFSLPTSTWIDFAMIPFVFMPQHAAFYPQWRDRLFNYELEKENGARTSAITVAEISIGDQQMGVFSLDFPRDPDQVIDQFFPSVVDNPPQVSPAASAVLWDQEETKFHATHTLEAIVSVTPAIGENGLPDASKYLTVSTPDENGAEGEPVEWLSQEEVARYPYIQGLESDQVAISAASLNIPSNLGVLVALAQAQANISLSTFRDRWAGYVVWPGADISKLRLFGPCRAITIEFTPQTGLRSYYDLTEPLPIPQLTSLLTPAQRRIVYGQLNPTD